ncbi:MAG: LEA type 2 family protein [Trueperaceae bacterium]
MHRSARFIVCLALFVLLAGCVPRSDIRSAQRIGEIVPPEFRLVDGQTSVERFDPPGAGGVVALTVGTSVFNPNPFPIKVTSIDYSVALEGRQVTSGSLELEMFIVSEGTAPLRFDIETALQNRPALLREVVRAFTGEPLGFRIEGRMVFNSLAYEFRTNKRVLVEGETVARESVEAPTLRMDEEESQAYLLSPDVPVVRLVLRVGNPGDVGYFLYGKDLTLTLGGHSIATDDLRPVPLPGGASSRVDIIFYPHRAGLSREARAALEAALSGIPTSLELSGRLSMDVLGVDAFAVPDGWRVTGFVHADRR